MKRLISEEFKKIKASKFLVILSIAQILGMMIAGFTLFEPSIAERWYEVSIDTIGVWPFAFFFLYGVVVVKMIASEFENYVVGDAIRAGVGRKQYFVAKCIAIVIYTAVLELLMSLSLLLVIVVKYGMKSGMVVKLEYVGFFVLQYFIMVLLICVMNTVAMLISYACKHFGLATAAIFVLFVIVDYPLSVSLIDHICGPLGLLSRVAIAWSRGYAYVLKGEFWLMLIPSVIVGVAAVVASYIIFMKTNFASVEEREAEQK